MQIIYNEAYLDDKAENSDEGVREQFTGKREYTVSESFGRKMVESKKAIKAGARVEDRVKKNNKL